MSYVKVYKYKKQISLDNGVTWQDVTPEEYAPSGDPIGYYGTLEECMTQYRTIQSGYTCVGYDKHNQDVYEVSYDNGVTWEVVSTSAGTLVEADSPDCGYIPNFKYKLALSDSSTISAECDSTSSSVTSGEVSSQYSGTVVSAEIGECVTEIGDDAFYKCSGLTSIDIPNSVTSIGNEAFTNCSSLTSIDIPDSVTYIGDWVFGYCTSLTSVTMSDSITTISTAAFYGCSSLTSITIPSGVTTIGTYAFNRCTGLTSVDIPSGVTTIGSNAFNDCSSITSITVDSNNAVYDSRNNCNAIVKTNTNTLVQGCNSTVIPNSITSIGDSAFAYCRSLTSMAIPSSVTSFGGNAFQGCSSLTSITIPNSVTSIGNYAFSSCSSLTSVDIPSGVTSIGGSAFRFCSGLASVTVNATNPPTLGSRAFDGSTCPIYVPSASVNAFKTTSGWRSYSSRIQAIP